MNNKGFAITSVIYGLAILGLMIVAILMGTLSSTRNNVSEEAKMVEEFLIAVNQTEVTYRGVTDANFRVPLGESGWYRVESFGAGNGGQRGAYATGIIYLNEREVLKVSITNASTTISMGSTILMRASAAQNSQRPGGVVTCFDHPQAGGRVNMNTYQLIDPNESFTGLESVGFKDCPNANYVTSILGHPSSQDLTTVGTHDYYFVDGLMIAAANANPEGKVVIQRLAERDDVIPNIPRKNHKLDSVSTITVSPATGVSKIRYTYHAAFSGGKFVETVGECSGASCTIPGGPVAIDDISIIYGSTFWTKNAQGVTVSANGTAIWKSTNDYGVTIGPAGIHISAYQPDSIVSYITISQNNFPSHGNYYLFPVVSDNKVVSAVSSAENDSNQLKIEYMTGESRQKWSIDLLNDPDSDVINFPNIGNMTDRKEYRITELTRFKSLNIYYDENYKMNFVSASETFNSLSRNEPQIWNIFPLGDGTYGIKTVVPSFTLSEKSGFLFAKPNGDNANNLDDVMIGLTKEYNNGSVNDRNTTPTPIERFFLYSLDFSA